jgi:hypothetical protein
MAIKPVDFQVAIPRTTEASKVSSNDANRNLAQQQQAANSVQHKAEDNLKQVYSRSKSEEARIRDKQKENGKGNGKKDGGKDGEDRDKDSETRKRVPDRNIKTSTIDIKI